MQEANEEYSQGTED